MEFALVIAILVALATGVADAGMAFRIKHVLKVAAREGARLASVQPDLQSNDPVIRKVVEEILKESDVNGAEMIVETNGPTTGLPVTVKVTYNYNPLFPGLGLSGPLVLQSETTMRYEVVGS